MTLKRAAAAQPPVIVWLRQDLRLEDNPALQAGLATGAPLALLYILDEAGAGDWPIGGASRWWLHASLTALGADIAARGGALSLRRGPAQAVLQEALDETGARQVFWNRLYEPAATARDAAIKQNLKAAGIGVESFKGALLYEPWEVRSGSGEPFKVFSPFWRACRALPLNAFRAPAPERLPASPPLPSERLEDWRLTPRKPDWAAGFPAVWKPGEAGAKALLARFVAQALPSYAKDRDKPGQEGSSRLSPHLHWGEISPGAAAAAAEARVAADPNLRQAGEKFLAELGWREFSTHLLHAFPELPSRDWRPAFARMPWREDPARLAAWKAGRTGYPMVDAGLRELWATGWMHNRVRMIVASFLIKHLLIDWRVGQAWFWDTLVDADLANNAASWQWVAGSGADAAPYFRIFNPVTQGESHDPEGVYVRRWIPEIAGLPDAFLHQPWAAAPDMLERAGVRLGATYPHPIVDHATARRDALAAYERVKAAG